VSEASAVRFARVSRRFGSEAAVDDLDLDIAPAEFFTLLGPSGSGKTTCLRLVAGFDRPNAGRILLHGVDVTSLPPYERDVNTVFQDYALFPHMSVADNVGYGLRVRGVPPPARARAVAEMLELVELGGFGERRPSELSGGQKQRVAVARALINHPRVLLLDEPLGALDLKLRQQMQGELKRIQRRVGITFLYVTHDQEEALSMSDRIAVLTHGRVQQVGTPAEVYERPASAFVANFVGVSNIVRDPAAARLGSNGPFSLRPEKIRVREPQEDIPPGLRSIPGTVREVVYLGMHTRYVIAVDGVEGLELVAVEQNVAADAAAVALARGRRVRLVWDPAHERSLGAGDLG
jgi:putative spermidine/putrescine transport system ATP-binding protein